uniref:Uncharacterized protein n=1 Tax=Cacopsylla melanoneura TaxID=428564 RepID=A0A8D9DV88_9HEMI
MIYFCNRYKIESILFWNLAYGRHIEGHILHLEIGRWQRPKGRLAETERETGWGGIVPIGCHVSSISVDVSWVGSRSSFWVWQLFIHVVHSFQRKMFFAFFTNNMRRGGGDVAIFNYHCNVPMLNNVKR